MKLLLISPILIVLFSISLVAKPENIDSLINKLPSQKQDTAHYYLLAKIANAYSDSNYNKSMEYWQKALELSEKINQRNLVADSYHQLGYCYQNMGEFILALKNLNYAAEIYSYLNDQKNLAGVLNDIGLIYRNWGKYDKALENYLKGLKIFDETLDIEGSAMISNSIGQIYYYRENYPKAIEYFIRYFDVNNRLNNHRAVAGAANNIASAYLEIKKYDDALQYYLKALRIYDSLNVKIGVAIIRDNIGSLYYQKQQYDDALLYHNSALNIFTELNSPVRMSNTLRNIGMLYIKQERFSDAISKLNESLKLAEQTGQKDAIKDVYQVLAEAYRNNENYRQAYDYLKLYDNLKDSIINAESIEKIERLQAEFDSERRENEISLINQQLEVQRKIIYAFIGFAAILILLSLLLLKENREKKKAISSIENIKTKILDKLSSTCSNMNVIKHDSPLGEHFAESWQIKSSIEDYPKSCMLHFKIEETTFAYLLVIKEASISAELINLTLFNLISDIIKTKYDRIFELDKIIEGHLLADPLTASFDPLQYILIPIILDNKRVLCLSKDYFAVKQLNSLITVSENQWLNLKKGDIVYLYTTMNFQDFSEDKKAIRKVLKSLVQLEFSEQQEVALNYLKSYDLDDSAIIFALKV